MSTIIFTGAGASVPLGYPSTYQFFENLSTANQENLILNRIKELSKQTVLDVEFALRILVPVNSFLETTEGKLLHQVIMNNWLNEIPILVKKLQLKCFEYYGKPAVRNKVIELFMPIFQKLNWDSDGGDFFTTNYDPVTDTLIDFFDSKNVSANDGFDARGVWNEKLFTNDGKTKINFYKLHGSLSWIINGDDKIINTRDYSIRSSNQIKHILIYPGYKGNPEIDGFSPIKFAHLAFFKKLKTAEYIFFIGYSFRDSYLNSLLNRAMSENPSLLIIIINPEEITPIDENSKVIFSSTNRESRIIHIKTKFGFDFENNFFNETFRKIQKYKKRPIQF